VSVRVARSRRLVAEGYPLATVARVMQISGQALYRTPTARKLPQRRAPTDVVEQVIVAEALANQTDGYRMICAFVRRRLGVAVNRKRVLRVMGGAEADPAPSPAGAAEAARLLPGRAAAAALAARHGAPRGALESRGGERTPPPVCRSRPVKLGAA
jgi:HTH-like domain